LGDILREISLCFIQKYTLFTLFFSPFRCPDTTRVPYSFLHSVTRLVLYKLRRALGINSDHRLLPGNINTLRHDEMEAVLCNIIDISLILMCFLATNELCYVNEAYLLFYAS
jgi:hypothetical protein